MNSLTSNTAPAARPHVLKRPAHRARMGARPSSAQAYWYGNELFECSTGYRRLDLLYPRPGMVHQQRSGRLTCLRPVRPRFICICTGSNQRSGDFHP